MPSATVQDGPVAKRRKVDSAGSANARTVRGSRIFAPFRTIGLVSPTPVPFTATPLGKTTFQITTSVGRALQTYDLRRGLQLVFISRPQTPGLITASAAWTDRVLAAWSGPQGKRGVWIFKRGKRVGELQIPSVLDEDVVELVNFGSWIVGCCNTKVEVWSAASGEHYTTLAPPFSGGNVLTGGICTLPTYTNKICAGREDGSVEVWNVSSGKLIYRVLPPSSDAGPVSAIQPAPDVSLVAVAYVSGLLVIHDIHSDRAIVKLKASNSELSPITSITFRTDGLGAGEDGQKAGVMATASFNSGDITLWDLNHGGRRMATLRNAHGEPLERDGQITRGGVSKIEFLPGQSILVSSGLDNTLKTWISDETPFSPLPRILHSRSGHAAPINTMQFLPTDADGAEAGGKWLLSGSQDRSLWGWSLRKDAQSTELSQGNVQRKAKKLGGTTSTSLLPTEQSLKAPDITCMACCMNRDGGIGAMPGIKTLWASAKQLKGKSTSTEHHNNGWESVVTGHKGDRSARTWYWGRKRAGRWVLDTSDGTEVKSVCISPCGTFAVIGSAGGSIDMYNLQSGFHRQHYPAKLTPAQQRQLQQTNGHANGSLSKDPGRHTGEVTGVHVDNLNHELISCGSDGKIKFWDFHSGRLQHEIDWSAQTKPTLLRSHRPSGLLAIGCDDACIRVVDPETRKLIRELSGCGGNINDICFSNDGRWIVAASSDSTFRVWDLPTGHLIDAVRLRSPCTALAFSNTGEVLATAQEDSIGINLWTNRALFVHISTHQIQKDDVIDLEAPTTSGEGGQNLIEDAFEGADNDGLNNEDEHDNALPSLDQLSSEVETLSLVPRSRWQTLLNLDLIRERNKPREAPKAPEKAPFFLPALDNAKPDDTAALGVSRADVSETERSRVRRFDANEQHGKVTALVQQGQPSALIDHLKTLGPAAVDIEIRSLNPTMTSGELIGFIGALTSQLQLKKDYELVQAWMAVFLRCHGEVIQEQPEVLQAIERWRVEQRKEAERLAKLSSFCTGVVTFLRTTR